MKGKRITCTNGEVTYRARLGKGNCIMTQVSGVHISLPLSECVKQAGRCTNPFQTLGTSRTVHFEIQLINTYKYTPFFSLKDFWILQ